MVVTPASPKAPGILQRAFPSLERSPGPPLKPSDYLAGPMCHLENPGVSLEGSQVPQPGGRELHIGCPILETRGAIPRPRCSQILGRKEAVPSLQRGEV